MATASALARAATFKLRHYPDLAAVTICASTSGGIASHCTVSPSNDRRSVSLAGAVGHYDARANVFPRRTREDRKIDAAVALIMALARCVTAKQTVSVYETRGLLVLG
jgi:hypothetical protein